MLLAAEAAMRAGAGKLQVATVASRGAARRHRPAGGAGPRAAGDRRRGARAEAADAVRELAEAADAVLIGPGHGRHGGDPGRSASRLLPHLRGPLALDALGLACVTADEACLHHLGGRAVLTPNPTELAHSLHVDEDEVDEDPAGATRGARRAAPGRRRAGRGDLVGRRPRTAGSGGTTAARAGLGVSGSGDVRAGITGGLLARGADPAQAAVWAAYLHGRCGERLSSSVGRLGFLARELPPEIPRAYAEIVP